MNWATEYNRIIAEALAGKRNRKGERLSMHHIIPKSVAPEFADDPSNLVAVSYEDHARLHYCLWKSNPKYALQLWLLVTVGRKFGYYELPGGDAEYEQLKRDVSDCLNGRLQ